jgi:autotransporter-associated beta strand protein
VVNKIKAASRLRSTLAACGLLIVAASAHAQSSLWNSYQGSSQVQLNYAPVTGTQESGLHYLGATLSTGTLASNISISQANGNSWTVDTGSEGMVITANLLATYFHIDASQFNKPSTQTITYTSSSLTYQGFYQNLNVGLYGSDGNGNGTLTATAKQMPVFIATSGNGQSYMCPPNCSPTLSDSLEQMGIGFGRGTQDPTSPGAPPRVDTDPLLNLTAVTGANIATMAPGYVVTASSLTLGLTAAQLGSATFVKLLPIPIGGENTGSAYQIAATASDWQTPAMTLVIKNANPAVNGTYYGSLLVDTGLLNVELATGGTTSPGLTYNPQNPLQSSGLQIYLPGEAAAAGGAPVSYTLLYQGSCNAGTYACPVSQDYQNLYRTGLSPVYPTNSKNAMMDGIDFVSKSGTGPFINTGGNFLNYFNIVFDPVDGFIGYQVSADPMQTDNNPALTPTIALQGSVAIPAGSTVSMPSLLFEEFLPGTTPQTTVQLSSTGLVTMGGAISSALYCSGTTCSAPALEIAGGTFVLTADNSYPGATVIDPGARLALAGAGGIAASSGVVANGIFDISGTAGGASVSTLSGAGWVSLGGQALTLTNASGSFGGVLADGGLYGGAGGGLAIAGGIQTLTGANTYTGATTIGAGAVLALAGTGSIAGSSGLTANGVFDISQTTGGAKVASLAGSGQVDLGAQALTIAHGAGGFGGVIADGGLGGGTGGSVTIAGGTQALTGVNTYTGGTTITGGATLAINADAALGAPTGTLTFNDGTLSALGTITTGRPVIVESGGATIDANGFTVSLGGPLLVNGPLTVGGAVTLSGKLTEDNGTLNAPSLTVAPDAMLRGVGVVAAPTTVAGTLAPGNSPGTLTFTAAVAMLPGSVTQFDIDGTGTGTGAGNYSRLPLTGAASTFTAGGTLVPLLRGITGSATNTYTPPLGQEFLVVNAQGGIQGSYSGLTQPAGLAAGTRFDALYGPTALALVVTPQSYGSLALAGIAETANQSAVGGALDAGRPAAGVAMTAAQSALYAPLYPLSAAAIPGALESLGPTVDADGLMVWRDAWYLAGGAIGAAMETRRGGQPDSQEQTAEGPKGSTIWLTALGQFDSVGSAGGVPGYSGSTGGVATGVDMPVLPWLTAGGALAFTSPQVSTKNSQTFSGQALQVTAYGSAHRGIFFLDGQFGGLFFQDTTQRPLPSYGAQADGQTGGAGVGGSIRAGAHLQMAAWQVEPSLGLAGLGLSQGGFTETQAGAANLTVGSQGLTSIQSVLAARAERRFAVNETMALIPTARIGWLHEFADTVGTASASFAGGGGPFSVESAPIGRDAALIGLGATLQTGGPASFYLAYSGAFAQNANAQTVNGGVSIKW